ncbi:hypothetical protein ABG067_006898 [Albugo candida]|uniref:Uncharacterized protein n=1 Tax=Albugo candida TaxID=65357 RepID=A0A024FU74_9STRA|nr:unnamed protein product [Albugo candida]|eukprot:CCI10214.1 unnamed protein product [Albugo candida]
MDRQTRMLVSRLKQPKKRDSAVYIMFTEQLQEPKAIFLGYFEQILQSAKLTFRKILFNLSFCWKSNWILRTDFMNGS